MVCGSASPRSAWASAIAERSHGGNGKDWTAVDVFEDGEDAWLHGVGDACTIRRWNGETWTTIHRDREDLHDICSFDEEDVWAVGDHGLVLRTRIGDAERLPDVLG